VVWEPYQAETAQPAEETFPEEVAFAPAPEQAFPYEAPEQPSVGGEGSSAEPADVFDSVPSFADVEEAKAAEPSADVAEDVFLGEPEAPIEPSIPADEAFIGGVEAGAAAESAADEARIAEAPPEHPAGAADEAFIGEPVEDVSETAVAFEPEPEPQPEPVADLLASGQEGASEELASGFAESFDDAGLEGLGAVEPPAAPPELEEGAPTAAETAEKPVATLEVPLEERARAGVESVYPPSPPPAPVFDEVEEEGGEPEPVEPPLQPSAEESFGDLITTTSPAEAGVSEAADVGVAPEAVEQIARRVIAQVSEKVVREIAWEVIPELAEALITQEIERLKKELQET
jgi:hypothetical protein